MEKRRNPGRRKSDKMKPYLQQSVIFMVALYVGLTGQLLWNNYAG